MKRLVVLLCFVSWSAHAAYPEKPIRFVIPSAAGGSPDVLMRILTQQLSAQMNVPIVVENKPGASFVLGTMDVVKAQPDGYTLGYGNIVSLAINRSLLGKVPYDVEKDLTLVSNCVRVFNLLAMNNDLPVRSVAQADRRGGARGSRCVGSRLRCGARRRAARAPHAARARGTRRDWRGADQQGDRAAA